MTTPLHDVLLRPATSADRAAIERVLVACDLTLHALPDWIDRFWVAEKDGQTIGVAGIEIYAEGCLLRSVAVLPAWRSTGLGRAGGFERAPGVPAHPHRRAMVSAAGVPRHPAGGGAGERARVGGIQGGLPRLRDRDDAAARESGLMPIALLSDIHADPWPDEIVALLRDRGDAGVARSYDSTVATGYTWCSPAR